VTDAPPSPLGRASHLPSGLPVGRRPVGSKASSKFVVVFQFGRHSYPPRNSVAHTLPAIGARIPSLPNDPRGGGLEIILLVYL